MGNYPKKIKKVLITQNALRSFAGSEIVTLELASFFKQNGIDTTVFTWHYSNPIKKEFEKRKITVVIDEKDKRLNQSFDLIWINHQVLPEAITKKLNKSSSYYVFNHMSSLDDLYLEQPYIYNLEKQIGSASLFVSDEVMLFNKKKYGNVFSDSSLFPNSSPDIFMKSIAEPTASNKILVVSNHPPKELEKALPLLENAGFIIESIGQASAKSSLVTPALLKQYCCVISIGKTVQYCLTLNIPIYLYDHFGGCGFLNDKNYEKAMFSNFSGRGFSTKTPSQIAKEIVDGISLANTYQTKNLAKFKESFSLTANIKKLLASLPNQPKRISLNPEYINYALGAELLTKQKITAENDLCILHDDLRDKKTKLETANNHIADLEKQITELKNVIDAMNNSRLIKLDKKIRSIPSRVRKSFEKQETIKINKSEFSTTILKKPKNVSVPIIGLIREKNESLILKDTLNCISKIVDGFIIIDDCSDDNSIEIAENHPKCLAIIKHNKAATGNLSKEESIHRQLILDLARKYHPKWLFYQDADERVDEPEAFRKFMKDNINNDDIEAIRLSLFDAYMTVNDCSPFTSDKKLLNFRKYFGPERRDIIMAWKNSAPAIFITGEVMREPDGIDPNKTITKFFVQHYGKSLSVDHWEETCEFYVNHFPQYAQKWQERKGKGIHTSKSDFDRPLMTWEEAKKTGGVKIN